MSEQTKTIQSITEYEKFAIPKLQDLIEDKDIAFKNDQVKVYLNQEPPKQWIIENKLANNSLYLPIDKVERLLDVIFQKWKVEVLEYKVLFNSVSCSIRLHYCDRVSGEWMFHDGVGAKELQTKKDTGVLKPDFSNVNKSAVEMALPIAKTMAIKDAADHLGKLFGRDLNRKFALEYQPVHKETPIEKSKADEQNNILNFINSAKTLEELNECRISIEKLNDKSLLTIFEKKQKELQ